MRVCVVGAGIGGLALTRGLIADGHEALTVERGTVPAAGGAAVTIFSNGMAAATGLGVDLTDLGGDVDELTICRSSGAAVMRADLRPVRMRTGHPIRTIPRMRLIERLASGLDEACLRCQTRVTSVRAEVSGATVELGDGSILEADVVVGADGYRSAVRSGTLADGPPGDVGWITWQGLGTVLPGIAVGTRGHLVVGRAGLAGFMPAGDGLTQWWFDARSPCSGGDGGILDWLHAEFGSYAAPVPELLASIGEGDIGSYPHVLRDPAAPWGRGAITLLGDAAHAFPPSQAQGANQALEDAWLLRRALGQASATGDVSTRLRRYERTRAARVRIVSRMAASERTNRPPGPVLGLLARITPAGVAGRGYLRVIRRISSVLHDDAP